MTQHNWPDVVIALIPVLILVMQYYQTVQGKRVEAKVDTVEAKVEENSILTNDTKLMVNSSSQIQMELRIVDLKELLTEKPNNVSVLARLEAAEKLLADHKTKDAVMKDRGRSGGSAPGPSGVKSDKAIPIPIVVSEIIKPVEIKTKS